MKESKAKEKDYKLSTKRKIYAFFDKIVKVIWIIIITALTVEAVLIVFKFTTSIPQERTCIDYTNCFNYCGTFSGAQCLVPQQKDTNNKAAAWRLLLTGKRNILEVLNPNQGYCACEYQTGDGSRLDTFYQFYSENK